MQEANKIQEFLKEYGELVKKYNVDFANYPLYVPAENGEFKTVIRTTPVDLDTLKEPEQFIK